MVLLVRDSGNCLCLTVDNQSFTKMNLRFGEEQVYTLISRFNVQIYGHFALDNFLVVMNTISLHRSGWKLISLENWGSCNRNILVFVALFF